LRSLKLKTSGGVTGGGGVVVLFLQLLNKSADKHIKEIKPDVEFIHNFLKA